MQYFCRVREEQLRLYLIFTSIKMHMFGKHSTLSHKETTCCHHSLVKIILNFWVLVITALPPVPPHRIKITVSRCKQKPSPITANFELLSLLDEVDKIDSCVFVFHRVNNQPNVFYVSLRGHAKFMGGTGLRKIYGLYGASAI